MIFFVISVKMVFLFPRKYDIFSLGGKWKKMVFIKKTRGSMIFSVYMRRRYVRGIALLAKKQRYPPKIHLRVTSPASPKKMIFILDLSYFCWSTKFIDNLERAQEAATGYVLQEKVFLEILQISQGETFARASFLVKACNFIKKEALAQMFSSEFWEISYRTPLSGCFCSSNYSLSFMETFMDVFIYCFPVKEKRET